MSNNKKELYSELDKLIDKFNYSYAISLNRQRQKFSIFDLLKQDGIKTEKNCSKFHIYYSCLVYLYELGSDSWKIEGDRVSWFTGGVSDDRNNLANWHDDSIELNCSQYRFDGKENFVVIRLVSDSYIIFPKDGEKICIQK